MSLKLTIEFESFEALTAFAKSQSGVTFTDIKEAVENNEAKEKKSRSAKKEKVEETTKVDPFATQNAPATLGAANAAPVAIVQSQASVAAAPVTTIDRQAYHNASVALVTKLKEAQIPDATLVNVMQSTFAEAGCAAGSKISTITDAEMVKFYPIFEKNATQALASLAPVSSQNFV